MNVTQGQPVHSIEREQDLLRRLEVAGACCTDQLTLTIVGRYLFLDGFVESLDQKLQAGRVCHDLYPGLTVDNRLRVAHSLGRKVS